MTVIPIRVLAAQGSAPEAEAARALTICNACRYCEGFCAVFPAMTQRLTFTRADVHHLANLCHACGACFHACQYAPPHEFAVNVPRAMAQVRRDTYAAYAWPAAFGAAYARNGLVLALALAGGLALFLLLAAWRHGGGAWRVPAGAGFYDVFPHGLMVSMFAPVFAFAVVALAGGVTRFWRDQQPGPVGGAAAAEAAGDVLRLKYLGGGHGQGCNEDDDAFSLTRRRFHHAAFYGFALCFASTSTATLYHYALGWPAPYGWTTLPKLLGIAGGVLLVAGSAGLFGLNLRRDRQVQDAAQHPMDRGFIALLALTGASGLALMLARGSPALPLWLCLHLGAVMAFFATMPYGKFAHGVFRAAALLKWSVDKRRPPPSALNPD